MPNLLFWNLQGKRLHREVAALVRERDVHILVLAEFEGTKKFPLTNGEILAALNDSDGTPFHSIVMGLCERIQIFTQGSAFELQDSLSGKHYCIRKLALPESGEILVTMLHGPSKLHAGPEDQALFAREVSLDLRLTERDAGHRRSIVVGDFNMNPFEPGMVEADAFNAVMAQSIALNRQRGRSIRNQSHPFFYNPMWSFLGDRSVGPPGTYFYRQGGTVSFFWNMFDQVLIRPDMLPFFDLDSLSIVTSINGEYLLRNEIPDQRRFSDHLPIFFSLNPLER